VLSREHRETFFDFMLSCFAFYPFVCTSCHSRTIRTNGRQFLGAICMAAMACSFVIIAGLYLKSAFAVQRYGKQFLAASDGKPASVEPSARAVSRTPAVQVRRMPGILTNQDVMSMAKGGMSSTLVSSLIGRMEHKFTVDTDSLVELKRAGVPEDVILTMVDASRASPDKERVHPDANLAAYAK
jgi:hypothetical protein